MRAGTWLENHGGSRNKLGDEVGHTRRQAADQGRLQRALQLGHAGEVTLDKAKHRQAAAPQQQSVVNQGR